MTLQTLFTQSSEKAWHSRTLGLSITTCLVFVEMRESSPVLLYPYKLHDETPDSSRQTHAQ